MREAALGLGRSFFKDRLLWDLRWVAASDTFFRNFAWQGKKWRVLIMIWLQKIIFPLCDVFNFREPLVPGK